MQIILNKNVQNKLVIYNISVTLNIEFIFGNILGTRVSKKIDF